MTFTTFLSFFILTLTLVYSPGPMTMFLMAQGMKKQYGSIWFVLLGANNGYFLSLIIFMFGLSSLLQKNIIALKFFQIAGIVYLLYLAYAQWVKGIVQEDSKPIVTKQKSIVLYGKGMIIALSNPKTILLFSVIFPQFIVSGQSKFYQIAILVFTFLFLQVLSGWSYAYFGSRIKVLFDVPGYQIMIHRASSVILVLVAFFLASKL